ncbi:MAG: YndJ family transporter, partial [Acidobacteria bacterium]|nr:YndJ family transporter [Acidobacteriota bacterium]
MQTVSTEWRAASRRARWSALAGAALWLVLLLVSFKSVTGIAAIERLMLLGVLVIVPLGLSLVAASGDDARALFTYRLATLAQPFGAAAAVAALRLEQGLYAGLLACVWLAVTGTIALYGLARVWTRRTLRAEELALDAGLMYVSVGGAWFVMSRLGWQPLGFGSAIVLLTAV